MSYAPDEDVDEERIAEHEAERDLAPSDKVGEELEVIILDWHTCDDEGFGCEIENIYRDYGKGAKKITVCKLREQNKKRLQAIIHQKQVEAIRVCARMRGEWAGMDEDEFKLAAIEHLRKQT